MDTNQEICPGCEIDFDPSLLRKRRLCSRCKYVYGVPFSVALEDLQTCIRKNLTNPSFHPAFSPSFCYSDKREITDLKCTNTKWRNIWRFFFDVTELTIKCRCKNTPFIADLLEYAWEMSKYQTYINEQQVYDLMLRLLMSSAGKSGMSILEYIPIRRIVRIDKTPMHLLLVLPYRDAHRFLYANCDAVKQAVLSGNIGLLELLLKFGVTILMPEDSILEWKYTEDVMRYFLPRDLLQQRPHFIDGSLLGKFDPTSRKRLFLVMRILQILPKIHFNPEHTDKFVESVRLLFRSIPDAKVSEAEIQVSLEKLCRGTISTEKILSVCHDIKSLFPESHKPLHPRSLKHLSRCQVRENLRSLDSSFPVEVDNLRVPKSIKDYILLKKDKNFGQNPIMWTFVTFF